MRTHINVNYPILKYTKEETLELDEFKEMDYYAVKNYGLPIELMMENAGLQLANLVANFTNNEQIIRIGVGNGNNGGGGLVAARRLAAWGYKVYIDVFTNITKSLPEIQLKRALKFGVKLNPVAKPDVWIDTYFGFSQRLPLPQSLLKTIRQANDSSAIRISLDIPTGFIGDINTFFFAAHKVLTLAYPKKILCILHRNTELYVADLGIPQQVYEKFNLKHLPFQKSNILELKLSSTGNS